MSNQSVKLMKITIELHATPNGINHGISVETQLKEVDKLAGKYIKILSPAIAEASKDLSGSLICEYKRTKAH